MAKQALHVMMLGLRGFPGVQGGIETHAENLCPKLVKLGCKVTVLVRTEYQPINIGNEWYGIRFVTLWAPKFTGLETIVHTFIGVIYAAIKRPDILHIQAIGPSLFVPLARLVGLRVVVTHHGADYERQKWGYFARFILQLGERFGMCFANKRIVISEVIRQLVLEKYAVDSILIPNGVSLPDIPDSKEKLEHFGIKADRYVLLVSRIVPEKRHHDLIQAFIQLNLSGWKLVIVGTSDHPNEYSRSVLEAAESSTDIICTGFQSGEALSQLYAHAGIFVLPSSHEGLPMALLEAISYGLLILASDIPANKEVGLASRHYFPLGNISQLAKQLKLFSKQPLSVEERHQLRYWAQSSFSWDSVAASTFNVYLSARE